MDSADMHKPRDGAPAASFDENAIAPFRREILNAIDIPGKPSRQTLTAMADRLVTWRRDRGIPGLWAADPPLMLTATLDDGLGYGLALIERLGEAAGLRVEPLGLMLAPERIIRRCQERRPAILGMTVLQFDSEPHLTHIRRAIGRETMLIAGGPLFGADPDMARRIGIDHVAKDGCAFLKILLDHLSI